MKPRLIARNDRPLRKRLDDDERPTGLTIVTTLEVVVRVGDSNYVLATLFRYADGGIASKLVREGDWAPPALTHQVQKGHRGEGKRYNTVEEIIERFKKAKYKWKEDAEALLSILGLPDEKIVEQDSFIEVKPSFTNPHEIKAYKIIRARLQYNGTDAGALRCIADPLCVRGFAFIPTDRTFLQTLTSDGRLGTEETLYFLGKPIVSNLQRLLCDREFSGSLKEPTIALDSEHLVLDESGTLIQVDLAGFGAACSYLASEGNYIAVGRDQSTRLRSELLGSFSKLLATSGIGQARLTGDGVVCALPDRHQSHPRLVHGQPDAGRESGATVFRFLSAYCSHLRKIEEMNARLPERARAYAIGSRLALHHGDYKYGRVAGMLPLVADFDGDGLIAVARSEAALKEIGKAIDASFAPPSATDGVVSGTMAAHRVIVSDEFLKAFDGLAPIKERMAKLEFIYEGQHKAKLKETVVEGIVFKWSPSPQGNQA